MRSGDSVDRRELRIQNLICNINSFNNVITVLTVTNVKAYNVTERQ